MQDTPVWQIHRPEVKLLLGSTGADVHLLGSKVTSSRPYSPVRWLDACSFSKHTPRLCSSFGEMFSCQDLEDTQHREFNIYTLLASTSTHMGQMQTKICAQALNKTQRGSTSAGLFTCSTCILRPGAPASAAHHLYPHESTRPLILTTTLVQATPLIVWTRQSLLPPNCLTLEAWPDQSQATAPTQST